MNDIKDEGNDKSFFVITPRIVWARCSDPFEYTLWSVIKGIAGDGNECYLSTPDLAQLAMMSAGKVSSCRKSLIKKGLLRGELRKDPGYPQPVWHLSIPDLWQENVTMAQEMPSLHERIAFKAKQKEPSPGERGITPGENGLSPDETKNIHQEKKKDIPPPSGEKSPTESESVDETIEWPTPSPAKQKTKAQRIAGLQAAAGVDVGEGVIKAHAAVLPDEWVTVADAFCACLHGVRLTDEPEKDQKGWPRKLKTIAENIGASPKQMIDALRVMPEEQSGVHWKIPGAYSSPYVTAFESDIRMVVVGMKAGTIQSRGSNVPELRGRYQ